MAFNGNKYHEILADYFHAKEYFLESIDDQRVRAQRLPPTPRPVNIRKVIELPWQQIETKQWIKLGILLTDLQFLEAKAEAGKVFSLADDFTQVIGSAEKYLPNNLLINLLEEAIRLDIHFIFRHPTTIFQCIWNSCWWFDNPDAEIYFENPGKTKHSSSDLKESEKINKLLGRWRFEKERVNFGNIWIRSLRPYHRLNASSGILVLRGHLSPVQTVEFCPQYEYIASGSACLVDQESFSLKDATILHGMNSLELEVPANSIYPKDNSLRLWNSKNGMLNFSIESLEGPVLHCNFSPDGKFLAYTCSPDGNIHVFDIIHRNEINCFYGSGLRVSRLTFSPDGMHIASAGTDGCIRIRDTMTGADEQSLKIHRNNITDVKYSPDGRYFASSSGSSIINSGDNSLKISHIESGEIGHTFIRKAFCSIMCIAFLPDGKNIIAGTLDHDILIYNIEDGSELLIGSHKGAVLCVAVSPDGKVAASGSTDYTVRLWDLDNRRELACFHGHSDIVNAVSFSPDGLQIASGSADCTVRIWKLQKYKELQQELIEHKKDIMDIRFSDSGKYLISGSGDGKIHLHDESGVYMKSFQDSANIFKIGFAHAENKILSTDNLSIRIHELNGKTHFLNPLIGNGIKTGKGWLSHDTRTIKTDDDDQVIISNSTSFEISDFIITNDDAQIIAGCWNGSIRIWDSDNGSEICLYRVENEKPVGLKYSINEQRVIYVKEITCMAISQNSQFIVCGSADGTVRLWDIQNIKGLSHLKHSAKITSIAISTDNSLIASGAENGEIIIWECSGNNSFQFIKIHDKAVLSIAFGQHGTLIFSASSDKTAITEFTNNRTSFFEGRGDVTAMAANVFVQTMVPMVNQVETILTDLETGRIVAWFPSSIKYLCSHPKKSVWAGGENNHLRMFALEKFESQTL